MGSISRRNFLKIGALGGLGITSAAFAYSTSMVDTNQIDFSERPISIADLPDAFENYRIGFISDIHLGPCSSPDLTSSAVHLLKEARPDMVLMGGDFIWMVDSLSTQIGLSLQNSLWCTSQDETLADQLYLGIADLLAPLKCPDGVFGVPGNHDGWAGKSRCVHHLGSRDIRILVNQTVRITRAEATLTVVGCDDYWTGIPKLSHVPERKEAHEVRVLLAHNPDFISYVFEQTAYDFDLALAGHTHGGQIKLPGLGSLFCNIRDTRLTEGLFEHARGQVYTSRGLGVVVIPIRINCPPEVSVLRLVRA